MIQHLYIVYRYIYILYIYDLYLKPVCPLFLGGFFHPPKEGEKTSSKTLGFTGPTAQRPELELAGFFFVFATTCFHGFFQSYTHYGSMEKWYIYLHESLICMVNVGKYTIHGSYGIWYCDYFSDSLTSFDTVKQFSKLLCNFCDDFNGGYLFKCGPFSLFSCEPLKLKCTLGGLICGHGKNEAAYNLWLWNSSNGEATRSQTVCFCNGIEAHTRKPPPARF